MKSFAALLLCLAASSTSLAQQLPFPEGAATDPAAGGIATQSLEHAQSEVVRQRKTVSPN
jgi:hypothetical protein